MGNYMTAEASSSTIRVDFFRPSLTEAEIEEVVDTLRSGWLTAGPKVARFEHDFARFVNARYALAVNSCTSALMLALSALDLKPGQTVLVPTMTFAATAEAIVRHGALPLLVDCEPETLNLDLRDAEEKIQMLRAGRFPASFSAEMAIAGIIPVHVGGLMMDGPSLESFARRHDLWVVEDAAHAFPAARRMADGRWQLCGDGSAHITCFSFYANKPLTTGEGGMAVTNDSKLAERMKAMSLHGLSRNTWDRHSDAGWDYEILEPGYKFNLSDVAASIGMHQLARANDMRQEREKIARFYLSELANVEQIDLPIDRSDRIHSWHLFPIRLNLSKLSIDRNAFIGKINAAGVGCSVHWKPLHLHHYYRETLGLQPADLPVASSEWERLVSLPIFPGLRDFELSHVVNTIKRICQASAV